MARHFQPFLRAAPLAALLLVGSGHSPPVLTATLASVSSVKLKWTSGQVTNFVVERGTDGVTFATLATLPKWIKSFTDTTASGGVTYFYRVGGFKGDMRYSNVVTVTPPWAATYGAPGDEDALGIDLAPNGDLVVAGTVDFFSSQQWDGWVLRLGPAGAISWQKNLATGLGEWANHVVATADGGALVVGLCNWVPGNGDAWVAKLSSGGSVEWQNAFGGADYDEFLGATQTTDGGYILSGYTFSFGAGASDLWLVKLTGAGSVEWQRTYGSPGWEGAGPTLSVIQTKDGDYAVATAAFGTDPFLAAGSDVWVLKIKPDGTIRWVARHGGTGDDVASQIVEMRDGDLLVLASTTSFGAGDMDYWVLRLKKANGKIRFQRTYGGPGADFPYCVGMTQNDNNEEEILVAGTSGSFGGGDWDWWILRIEAWGTLIWQKKYGGPDQDWVYSMKLRETPDRGFVVAGSTASAGSGGTDMLLLKLAPDGTIAFNPSSPLGVATTGGVVKKPKVKSHLGLSSTVTVITVPPVPYTAVVGTTFAVRSQQAP